MEASDPKPKPKSKSKPKPEPIIPKLPLFSPQKEMSNITSPVHHTIAASVPFQWEKEPGKPNTINLPINKPKSLEPPPRLYSINTPSPTTVLDGPYYNNNKISSSSFRFLKNISKTPETEQFVKKGNWWQRNVKRKIGSNSSSVFLSSMDSTGKSCSARMGSFRRNGSSSNLYATKSNMMWVNNSSINKLSLFDLSNFHSTRSFAASICWQIYMRVSRRPYHGRTTSQRIVHLIAFNTSSQFNLNGE